MIADLEDPANADLDILVRVVLGLDGAFFPGLGGGLDVDATRPFPLVLGACTSSTTSDSASSSPESELSGLESGEISTSIRFDRVRETARVFLAWDSGGGAVGRDEIFFE